MAETRTPTASLEHPELRSCTTTVSDKVFMIDQQNGKMENIKHLLAFSLQPHHALDQQQQPRTGNCDGNLRLRQPRNQLRSDVVPSRAHRPPIRRSVTLTFPSIRFRLIKNHRFARFRRKLVQLRRVSSVRSRAVGRHR